MSRLHCLSNTAALHDCLVSAAPGDNLLLLGDGCYAALNKSEHHERLLSSQLNLYALSEDARSRGVEPDASFTCVDYAGFVALTESCQAQQAWF